MGAHVDAQRLSHPRTREDVEEPRKFVTIRAVLKDYPGEVVRLCLLKSRYRENVEYDEAGLAQSQVEWTAMRAVIAAARSAHGSGTGGKASGLVSQNRAASGKRWTMT